MILWLDQPANHKMILNALGFDRNGPSTLRALAHAPISSAFPPNR